MIQWYVGSSFFGWMIHSTLTVGIIILLCRRVDFPQNLSWEAILGLAAVTWALLSIAFVCAAYHIDSFWDKNKSFVEVQREIRETRREMPKIQFKVEWETDWDHTKKCQQYIHLPIKCCWDVSGDLNPHLFQDPNRMTRVCIINNYCMYCD